MIRKTLESSSCVVSEEEKENSSSDEAWGQTFTPSLHHWRSYSPTFLPDRWPSPRKGPVLEPASLPNSLYWACWVWVRSHLQWRTLPKSGPYNYYSITYCFQLGKILFWSLNFIYNLFFTPKPLKSLFFILKLLKSPFLVPKVFKFF